MIARIIDWAFRNRFLVVFLTLFAVAAGVYSISTIPLDALPDLSDVQVIVYTEAPGQAPEIVEQQITYPLTSALLSVPRARTVRGYSFFGFSLVYVLFEDGTDHLLGTEPRAGVPQHRQRTAACGNCPQARSGCQRARLGLDVRPALPATRSC